MDWDLITERNIQLFIQLAGLTERPLATNMFWRQGQYETYLNYQNGRIHLCQILQQTFLDEDLLFKALTNWKPAMFQGIPQRLFLLRDGLAMSCSPPPSSSAELWLRLHHRQIKFLESQCVHV
ncbi:TPA_asm: SPI-2 type III secretion system apparatus protein SsaM [Salmonella enterica subsp. salamae serovar 60:g,m,t:z6]|uniref:SPI-2 type III secretion system apparatus protein SsaM n=1 Tax=Salmonella enterica subsp. houtenae serovar 1,40:z4,z32:- TaxID=1967604 RepID=A0A730WF40_SALHO|nr:SPI-2 type III secretion system apparatus protein SsaM [Salmonella enterica]HAC6698745.1 SPI-2 type III secretion system apparatus protein SsaM [Salmonella bongori serovar 66:z65:-]HAE2267534.1 SPI-2 type III secretion system apparatus protein SsaM [Salmonella enterica subsp. enterica serovar 1,9,12:-:-]HAE4189155.1 SPI-2 type III secretion system apparatus protein SsaM [Salmonella enterica subsp. houtenae serovar 1,40:z4,z32:-]HAE7513372.1 SPI-2 type III secretion system apparatus protein S